jgi:alkyl hydroperoxide reductase subunit AhpC
VKAFEALLMPNGVVKRYVVVSTKQVAQAYSAAQQLTIPVINDESGALSKDCGVLVNLGFSKFAKKALLQVDSTGLVKSSHLVLNVNDIHALHS